MSSQQQQQQQPSASSRKSATKPAKGKSVIADQGKQRRRPAPAKRGAAESRVLSRKVESSRHANDSSPDESSSSSQEMTVSNPPSDHLTGLGGQQRGEGEGQRLLEQETNIDNSPSSSLRPQHDDVNNQTSDDESATLLESCASVPPEPEPVSGALVSQRSNQKADRAKNDPNKSPNDWDELSDKEGVYFWHRSTGAIQRAKTGGGAQQNEPIRVLYHDDEEINQTSSVREPRTSSDEDDCTGLESGAALTLADDTTTLNDAISFVVYPLGCCEFDETQLISANSTKAIQKCILRLLNTADKEENTCWGLSQSHPILMRLLDDHIQFTDVHTRSLLRSQPIHTIKTWAVDDDNNFAFVVEDLPQRDPAANSVGESQLESVNFALLHEPISVCYVFSSMDDDDMSMKVATKLNREINRYREMISSQLEATSQRPPQMIDTKPVRLLAATNNRLTQDNDQTDADEDLEDQFETSRFTGERDTNEGDDDDDDDLAESSEITLKVRYIGKVQVPRPMGIDVLNVAIDQCLADASKVQMNRLLSRRNSQDDREQTAAADLVNFDGHLNIGSPLVEAKLHVSPLSVIVENEQTGEIIVECRIRYLTFMGISRRDIRWCGFIMQNTTNQSFVAHCFECYPTAGEVCGAIQQSCSRMYEKMVKKQRMKEQVDETTSILPKSSKIRDTLAKTLSRIKLTPII